MCAEGGLHLHKFISNSTSVLDSIPPKDRATSLQNLDLTFESLPIERALGVQWCLESDTFRFRIVLQEKPSTRRGILSTLCSVFDPLGFLAPVLLVGKQLLQQMCKEKADWDTPLSDGMRTTWEQWRSSLLDLRDLEIQRCVKPKDGGKIVKTELHHFSDASTSGYGQCSYLRQIDDSGRVHRAFVMGKARVAPLKHVTVRRLELTAAVVSVRVGEFLKRELKLENVSHFYWTDSRIVLGYVANEARRFHIFVANRIQQIRDVSDASQWHYIPTNNNPVDISSHGCDSTTLSTSIWFIGPEFLWNCSFSPETDVKPSCELIQGDPEIRANVAATNTQKINKSFESERLNYFSDWHKAKRAVAVCLWLKAKLRLKVTNEKSVDSPCITSVYTGMSVNDLNAAEKEIIRVVQREIFHDEINTLEFKGRSGDKDI